MKSEQIRKFFHPFTKIPGIRKLFGYLYRTLIYNPVRRKEIKTFQRNALIVLKEFDRICLECDVHYCLFWGSLIGAVREHGFIKHDFDIDVAVWKSDYSQKFKETLIKKGFIHKHRFLLDDGESGMEDTFEKDGVAIDVFYFYRDHKDGLSYCSSFDYYDDCVTWKECIQKHGNIIAYKFQYNLPYAFEYVPFENIQLPIPSNYDEILRSYYGDQYMTPDPNWHGGESEKNRWYGKIVKYIEY